MTLSPGLLEWFQLGEEVRVEQVLQDLARLGVSRLRTGVSWADYCAPGGEDWYEWLLPRLAREVEVLPCFVHTPPSMGIQPKVSSPPRAPRAYADWLDVVITKWGGCFEYVELWNEPNNLSEWDWTLDPGWMIFCEMIGAAAYWAQQRGKKTVLGGMAPVDPRWLEFMIRRGVIEYVDVVGAHAFPGLWEAHWPGWNAQIQAIRDTLAAHRCKARVWITETGYSTWRHGELEQLHSFLQAIEAPADRLYWYAVQDLHPDRRTADGFHTDEREYHLGIKCYNGRPKLLYRAWADGGPANARSLYDLVKARPRPVSPRRPVLITGGAGFVGARLAEKLAAAGRHAIVYDNLARPGAAQNLRRLLAVHEKLIEPRVADIRDFYKLHDAVREAGTIFHLAAEHLAGPGRPPPEFETNLRGTLNLLEAVRTMPAPPALIAASTVTAQGVTDLYHASRAAADLCLQNYARACELAVVILRFGCIYGRRAAGLHSPALPVASDGHVVCQLLGLDDAVDALLAAEEYVGKMKGKRFDITGGEKNAVSGSVLVRLIKAHIVEPFFAVSAHAAGLPDPGEVFENLTGWRPKPLNRALCGPDRGNAPPEAITADNTSVSERR